MEYAMAQAAHYLLKSGRRIAETVPLRNTFGVSLGEDHLIYYQTTIPKIKPAPESLVETWATAAKELLFNEPTDLIEMRSLTVTKKARNRSEGQKRSLVHFETCRVEKVKRTLDMRCSSASIFWHHLDANVQPNPKRCGAWSGFPPPLLLERCPCGSDLFIEQGVIKQEPPS
jgi:hypothetical protein